MCNPPFYSSHEDIAHSAEAKDFDPHAVNKISSQLLPVSLTVPSISGMYRVGGGNDNARRGSGFRVEDDGRKLVDATTL